MAEYTDEQLDLILDVRFDSDAGDDLTVREWLASLLMQVWVQQDDFSGKRPWGSGGWDWDLYRALVKAGHLEGEVAHPYDDDPEYEEVEANFGVEDGDRLVRRLIQRMTGTTVATKGRW